MTSRARELILATFLSLSVGFVAGYWMAGQGEDASLQPALDGGAPHAVGPQEFMQLGMQSLTGGMFDQAERYFRQAVALVPQEPEPHADLAVALMYQERWSEAAAELALAKEYGPDLPEVYFLEGVIARDGMQDSVKARRAWQRFLELAPADSPQAETVRTWLNDLDGVTPSESSAPTS